MPAAQKRLFVFVCGCFFFLTPVFVETPNQGVSTKTDVPDAMISIARGSFRPFDLPKKAAPIQVANFYLDVYPVTNAQFAQFIKASPEWRKDQIARIKADTSYLHDWNDTDFPVSMGDHPVTQVSWYAARAYCQSQGKRLPTIDEWEYAATKNGWNAEKNVAQIIAKWLAEPNSGRLGKIGSGLKSPQGVRDLHGLIWEWTEDFNSSSVIGDSRSDTNPEQSQFCGASSLSGSDLRNYPAYMRYALRSSLRGNHTLVSLGFRCARDKK